MSSHSVNTERVVTESRGQSHVEGGWPKEIDASEPQDTSKWRKRLDKDPQFHVAVSGLCSDVSSLLERNEAIEMFEEYFAGETAEAEMHSLQASTVGFFKDPSGEVKRTVSRISWHPDSGSGRFIASYSLLKFQRVDNDNFPLSSYVWEVSTPNAPVFEFLPPCPLVVTQYYSRNADLVAAGGMDGRVYHFDLRSGGIPVSVSAGKRCHQDAIFDLCWIQSKTHSELVSTSPDGRVLWWDVRNLAEPTDACVLPDDFGGCCIEWQQEAGPSKYLVGTEEGVGLALNKKPKKAVEVGGTWFGDSKNCGPVYAIKRNFFHPKYFLTVGDYSVRLWTEDLRSAVWKTRPSGSRLTCGGWSSVRAGVLFAARLDGVVEFYDLVSQMNASVYSHKVGDTPVSSLSLEGGRGRLMAVGDSAGGVTLVELCEELVSTTSAEKSAVGALLDREQRRERNLDALKKSAKSTPGGTFQENKTLFDSTIDKQQYITREQEWLAATGMPTDRGGWGVDSLL